MRLPLVDTNARLSSVGLGDVVDDAFKISQLINSNLSKETIALIVGLLEKYPQVPAESLTYIVNELGDAVIRRRARRRS